MTKPILKWVGGKTQILEKLLQEFPEIINNYREPFLGGGSVLLEVLSQYKKGALKILGKFYACDANEPLIYVYKNIQSYPEELYISLEFLVKEYNSCDSKAEEINRKPANIAEATKSKENYYYWIRAEYNRLSALEKRGASASAMFIFLNKTCFRGVFRVGPNGFNVPYGHYKNPEIINKEHLYEMHALIQGVVFECKDFKDSLLEFEEGDFMYLDPPYCESFTGYTENGFSEKNHTILFNLVHEHTKKNNKILLSNSDVQVVREQFSCEPPYKIISVLCKRSINSKAPESKAKEVIIRNY